MRRGKSSPFPENVVPLSVPGPVSGGRALTRITCLFFLRCLPENSEIWDIPWKLCSPGVSGLRGNLEPTRTGWGSSSTMGGREAPHIILPSRTCAPSICSKTPAIFPPSPLEVPWTDSHPRITGIPLTAPPSQPLKYRRLL